MAEHPTLTRERNVNVDEVEGDVIPWTNSIFEQPWWLDAVAPGQWNAAQIERGGKVVARLPYVARRRLGLNTIGQPPYTQTLGPWLAPSDGKYARQLENQKKLVGELIEQLPPFDFYRQSLAVQFTNWLPFYWAGFEASTRYTYRVEDLTDLDKVKAEFQDHVRRGIRKAQKMVEIDHDFPLERLLELNEQTFARQGMKAPHGKDVIRGLDAACAAHGARKILGAVDGQGRVHAALYIVWDDRTCYALINGRDSDLQTHGANTLLYWEAIQHAASVAKVFDFEGSMMEPIEHYFRGFGGRQTPYFVVSLARTKAKPVLAAWGARHAIIRKARERAAGKIPSAITPAEPAPSADPLP